MLRWIAAVALALLATPTVARACSCSIGFEVLWPEQDATGVPLNTRIWVAQFDEFEVPPLGEPLLRVFGGTTALDLTTSTIDTSNGPLTVLTPLAPLAPSTQYELIDCAYVECVDGTGGTPVTSFITGTAADTDPPPRPVETDRSGDAGGSRRDSCGKYKTATVRLDAEGLIVMNIGDVTFDPATLSGRTSVVTFDPEITVGRGACSTGWGTSVDSAPVRYGAFDLAGNFSGWTEPDTLTIGRGCGCRSDAPGAPSLLLLAVAALALRRRRRR